MFPEAFEKRILKQPYIDPEGLLGSLLEESPVSIRVNNAKWLHTPVNAEQVQWCRNGYYLEERPSFTLDPLFHAGCYYPQEASGMFIEKVFLQISGDLQTIKILDLCGAPGGKSTHLSTLIGNEGFLVSNEVIRQRAFILAENLTKWGLSNFIVSQSDPSAFGRLTGFFDMILVDAPCSGEGMFRDPVARNEWSPENAALCSVRQKRILMDIWPALKQNGILVYSTCTFNPEENEQNIKWLSTKQEAEPVRIDLSGFKGVKEIDHEGIFGYGFYPGRIRGEGLFIAVVRKKDKSINASLKSAKTSGQKISREERTKAIEWTLFPEDRFLRSGDNVIAAPCEPEDLQSLSAVIKVVKPGTKIFKVKKRNPIPSHDLAMSVFLKKNAFLSVDLSLSDALSYLRRDLLKVEFFGKGWNLVTYKGVNLGFANNIGTRFNNYYPVEWRIRMNIPSCIKIKTLDWME